MKNNINGSFSMCVGFTRCKEQCNMCRDNENRNNEENFWNKINNNEQQDNSRW